MNTGHIVVKKPLGKRFNSLVGVMTSVLSLTAAPLQAGLIGNPSFEAGGRCRGQVTGSCASQTPWVFTPGPSIPIFGVTNRVAVDGINSAYFGGGTVGSYDTISQLLATTPGQAYTLTFWLDTSIDHSNADFQVRWNGAIIYDDPAGTDSARQFAFTKITISSLTGTGSDTLDFQGYNPPGNDAFDLVDLMKAVPAPAAVPEPATSILMCIGSLALACRRRRG